MKLQINREGRRFVVKTEEIQGGPMCRFIWNEWIAGLMIGLTIFVSPYFILGVLLGTVIKVKKIEKNEGVKVGEAKVL